MKNVHYLIHGDVVNVSIIDTGNPVLKTPVLLVQIVVAFIGIAGIISVMPVAFTMDASRFIQFHYIKHKRRNGNNTIMFQLFALGETPPTITANRIVHRRENGCGHTGGSCMQQTHRTDIAEHFRIAAHNLTKRHHHGCNIPR